MSENHLLALYTIVTTKTAYASSCEGSPRASHRRGRGAGPPSRVTIASAAVSRMEKCHRMRTLYDRGIPFFGKKKETTRTGIWDPEITTTRR